MAGAPAPELLAVAGAGVAMLTLVPSTLWALVASASTALVLSPSMLLLRSPALPVRYDSHPN